MTAVLDGQVAVITGAARGLGRAMAIALAGQGAMVIVNHRDHAAEADALCAEIATAGGVAEAMQADVTVPAEVQAMMQAVHKKYRRIDILINNAGATRDNLFLMMTPAEWESIVEVNLTAVFHCTKAVIRIMAGQRRGVVVNIGSGAGLVAMPGQVNYSAAKTALLGFTKSAGRELAARGVRVVNIAAGFFKSDMTQGLPADFTADTFLRTPLGRWGDAAELVALVQFLVGPHAAGFCGQTLVIDGGRNAWEAEFGLV